MKPVKKILVKKEKKKYFDDLKKEITLTEQRIYYVDSTDRDYHTEFGSIKKSDLAKPDGSVLKSNKSSEFVIFSPSFIDLYKRISRGAQTVPLKDIGLIIAETGLNRESTVLDSGAGSGALSCALANIAKKVTTYEIREDFFEIVKSNIDFLGLTNIELKMGSIYEADHIPEKNVDLMTLDVPEPWLAIKTAENAVKPGGFLVAYSPSVPQVMDFSEKLRESEKFIILKTVEVMEREWEIDKRKVRPISKSTIHSGFMTFARKIS